MTNPIATQPSHSAQSVSRLPDAADVGGSAGIAAQLRRSILEGVYAVSYTHLPLPPIYSV